MSDSAVTTLLVLCVVCFVACVPLAPAIAMYKVAPKNQITATGVLAGLTINASGAIATYMIIFAALLAAVNPLIGNVLADGAMWTVYGDLQFVTADGKPATDIPLESEMRVEMEPRTYGMTGSTIRLTIPRERGHFPVVMLKARDRGVEALNLRDLDPKKFSVDAWKREVRLLTPVKLTVSVAGDLYQTTEYPSAKDLGLPPQPSQPTSSPSSSPANSGGAP